MSEVDLSQLAVDRTEPTQSLRAKRNLLTRYVLPGLLVFGFFGLIAWAAWDFVFPPRPVQVVPVFASQSMARAEGASLFNAAGWIEPRPTAIRVAALASGVVEELLVVEDQAVEKGQPVAELIKADSKLVYDRAIANRQLAEAELERTRATLAAAITRFEQPVHLEAELAQADANLAKVNTMLKNLPFATERAKAELEFAKRDYQRTVAASTSVSIREIDQSETEMQTSNALLKELKDREASLEKEVTAISQRRDALNVQLQLLADETQAKDESAAVVKAASARVRQMEVAEEEAALQLSRMTIRAPVDGRVYQLVGLPGARVGEGVMTAMANHDGSSIITMYQPASLQIRVDVRFEDIPRVSLGQPVRIDNPALVDPIVGRVLFISSEADIQKNTLQVKVAIDTPPSFFKPEMLVDVTFLSPRQDADTTQSLQELKFYLPNNVIKQSDLGAFVWLADQTNGVAKRIVIETGQETGDGMIEVMSGLDLGSRIITRGSEGLNEGDRITVMGESD